jgi:anti-anti-sigma factor
MVLFGMEVLQGDAGTCVAVAGELDVATVDAFAQRVRLLSASGANLLLDLSRVDFVDSRGLRGLLRTISDVRRSNGQIEVRPEFTPQVQRLLEITGTEASFSSG